MTGVLNLRNKGHEGIDAPMAPMGWILSLPANIKTMYDEKLISGHTHIIRNGIQGDNRM
jgi:hypothetical protein